MSKSNQLKRKTTTSSSSSLSSSSSSKPSKSSSSSPLAPLVESRFPLYPLPTTSNRRRWNVDLSTASSSSSASFSALVPITSSHGATLSSSTINHRDLTLPNGFGNSINEWANTNVEESSSSSSSSSASWTNNEDKVSVAQRKADLMYQSAMAVATAPGKQLLMTGFMLWMSGNSLQIFSIMMLGMAFWTPLQKILNVQNEFSRYDPNQVELLLPKLCFIACNAAGLALALYKSQTMGLLPTSPADWLSTAVRPPMEFSAMSVAY